MSRPAAGERIVDGVLLDVDDTIVDTRAAFEEALGAVARVYLPHLEEDGLEDVLATWRADVTGHYRRYTRGEIGYVEQRRARANELHERFGGPALDEAGFEEWDDVFEAGFEGAWSALPGAYEVVDRLVSAGVPIGALTNARVDYQTRKLARSGLSAVPVLVGMDTIGVGKPDPRVFAEACRRLGTAPARTAYVGDELDIDAVAAVRNGLVGVWLDRPAARRHEIPEEQVAAARAEGVLVVHALEDVLDVLGLD